MQDREARVREIWSKTRKIGHPPVPIGRGRGQSGPNQVRHFAISNSLRKL